MAAEFRKVITPNDRGLDPRSHQSGIAFHAPSKRDKFAVFPELSHAIYNDACVVDWMDPDGRSWIFRWVYFNNKFTRQKTRNEYRITQGPEGHRPIDFLEHHGLKVGDAIVFRGLGPRSMQVSFDRVDRDQLAVDLAAAAGSDDVGVIDVPELLDTERKAYKPSLISLGTDKDKVDPQVGWVYVLENPSMPGLSKIGFTKGSVDIRARQLSSDTGVPVPFQVAGKCRVSDPQRLESMIHSILDPLRLNRDREFFSIEPEQAVRHIESVGEVWSNVRPV